MAPSAGPRPATTPPPVACPPHLGSCPPPPGQLPAILEGDVEDANAEDANEDAKLDVTTKDSNEDANALGSHLQDGMTTETEDFGIIYPDDSVSQGGYDPRHMRGVPRPQVGIPQPVPQPTHTHGWQGRWARRWGSSSPHVSIPQPVPQPTHTHGWQGSW